MVLFVDIDLQRFVAAPGFGSSPNPISHKRGDSGAVQIQFCQGTELVSLEAGSQIIYQAKETGKYDGDPLIECDDFTAPVTAGGVYAGALSYAVGQLATAFAIDGDDSNDVASLAVMYEVSWKLPGAGWLSTDTLQGTIANDVIRTAEGVLPQIDLGVPAVAASAALVFDNTVGAAVDVTAGSVSVGEFSLNLWDGSTGSAPAEPYLSYPSGLTIWQTWAMGVANAINAGTGIGSFTLVGSLAASSEVTADVLGIGTDEVTLTLTADQAGAAGNSIAYSWATTPADEDASGNLAGGVDSRGFVQDDFVSTIPDTLTTSQKEAAISNLMESSAFKVSGDIESVGNGQTGLILSDDYGSRYRLKVDVNGNLVISSI